ncbi:phd finger domain protein [Niveomyces insectorum RCEF 264]|uniref:Phd finger domain protein n=1 Tax=Niveomyces insectorum RCEF 264 TaxID=1081102 RepID=A0A167U0X7_9HYPO|nr:phd finger domain protein [Niveomyces insectorum RCEF 264]
MVSLRKRPPPIEDGPGVGIISGPSQPPQPSAVPTTLPRLRNMWQFACICQWFYIFGGVVKLGDLDIEELEAACLNPHSNALQDIGLALLKYLSSYRGLTHDLFDEYTRRQYASKVPEKPNPFGTSEAPASFSTFSVFQKVRVIHQMTQFVMMNPEKLREKMAEQKDADHDQTTWRIEPFGWDRHDHVYYVLDDNRVYRLTEPPPPPAKPKRNTQKARAAARRSSKRRRISSSALDNAADSGANDSMSQVDEEQAMVSNLQEGNDADCGLGGMKWECVAATLDELRHFLTTISGKKDANERVLRDKIVQHLLPILEQLEEKRLRRQREREREMLNLAKMANAKRSSRIASRHEQQKQEEALREEELRRHRELEIQRKEEQKRRKLEKERDNRLMSREKRLRERDLRRLRHEEELAQLSEDSKSFDGSAGRMSERRRLAEIAKNKEALKELGEDGDDEEWVFDCICGLHGKIDDGQHSVSCEKCTIWQHSRCLGIDETEAEKDDFHFVCDSCRRREQEARNGRTDSRPLVVETKTFRPPGVLSPSTSPASGLSVLACVSIDIPVKKSLASSNTASTFVPTPGGEDRACVSTAGGTGAARQDLSHVDSTGGMHPILPSTTLERPQEDSDSRRVPMKVDNRFDNSASVSSDGKLGAALVSNAARGGKTVSSLARHPSLSQPDQSPRKLLAYGTIYEQARPPPQTEPSQHTAPGSAAAFAGARPPSLVPPTSDESAGLSIGTTSSFAKPQSVASTRGAFALHSHAQVQDQPQSQGRLPPLVSPSIPVGDVLLAQQEPALAPLSTPRLHHPDEDDHIAPRQHERASPPLLPSRGGLSPTKHSPTMHVQEARGFSGSSPAPPIIPPISALSPSTPMQNPTSPVKPEGQAHRHSFSGSFPAAASSPVAGKRF